MKHALASVLLAASTLCVGGGLAASPEVAPPELGFMLEEIREDARATAPYTGKDHISEPVLGAMARVPRAAFVPREVEHLAYFDRALPIGHGQTISQPFIVALMTDLLAVSPGDRVLEIGTGSGYQAAVLAELGADVHSIEIVPELARMAAERLDELGYQSVRIRVGDGWYGWSEAAPFDAIIVTAVAEELPPRLVEQLAAGGRMVLPVGTTGRAQNLTVVRKLADGSLRLRQVLPVQFVPLTGEH